MSHQDRHFPREVQPGQIVEIRSRKEIIQTLDDDGALDGLPFAIEMFEYCGKRLKILRRVNRLFVEGIGNRGIRNTVILEGLRCNGEAHGRCKRTCLFLWKDAWLKKVQSNMDCKLSKLNDTTRIENPIELRDRASPCQLARLTAATSRLPATFEDLIRQYLKDTRLGALKPVKQTCDFLLRLNFNIQRSLGRKKYATLHGALNTTPTYSLSLMPGELVQVKTREEILTTLDVKGKNRGLSFTAEMIRYCGGRYRVLKRVERMVMEKTGKLRDIANTVILDDVTCDGSDHFNCPQNCYCLWREIWLKRIECDDRN